MQHQRTQDSELKRFHNHSPHHWLADAGSLCTALAVLVNAATAEGHGTISLVSGTIAGQPVSWNQNQVAVTPGAALQGSARILVHNEMPSAAIAPLAATPTWGEPSTSYWEIDSSVANGDTTNTVLLPDTLAAPQAPGVYYIAIAMAGTYNSEQLISGTHPGFLADWVNGNKVALLPASDFELAASQGWIPFGWYTPEGPSVGDLSIAVIRVVVSDLPPPTLVAQPVSQVVGLGSPASFSVEVSGNGPFAYQWLLNGTPIRSATGTTLLIPGVTTNDVGSYSVIVSNACCPFESARASLTINSLKQYSGISILGLPGARYRIEYKEDLAADQWIAITSVTLSSNFLFWLDTESPSAKRRFYRTVPLQ